MEYLWLEIFPTFHNGAAADCSGNHLNFLLFQLDSVENFLSFHKILIVRVRVKKWHSSKSVAK